MTTSLVVPGAWIGALLALGWLAGRAQFAIPASIGSWLTVLFPSWRFFDECGPRPALLIRRGPNPQSLRPWYPAMRRPPVRHGHWISNPAALAYLADQTAIERLADYVAGLSPSRHDDLAQSPEYRIVARLAYLAAQRDSGRDATYQFKIAWQSEFQSPQDVLVSPIYPLASVPQPRP
ncbi:MAG: hypothetical protein B7733_16470 [Myxococcales bacterium FL481]|nr:MAG: hypothetical protein B7733_16470 [Myxococcales bacterium FL481]